MLVLVRPILSVDTIVPLKTLAISERMSSAFRIRGASTRALTPNIACNDATPDFAEIPRLWGTLYLTH